MFKEFGKTGSVFAGTFQILVAGKALQVPSLGWAKAKQLTASKARISFAKIPLWDPLGLLIGLILRVVIFLVVDFLQSAFF